MVTVNEAAGVLGQQPNRVRQWVRSGLIPAVRPGVTPRSQLFIRPEDLIQHVRRAGYNPEEVEQTRRKLDKILNGNEDEKSHGG